MIVLCEKFFFLFRSGCFTKDEAENYIKIGSLNGMFVLGRSIGFIGNIFYSIIRLHLYFCLLISGGSRIVGGGGRDPDPRKHICYKIMNFFIIVVFCCGVLTLHIFFTRICIHEIKMTMRTRIRKSDSIQKYPYLSFTNLKSVDKLPVPFFT